MDDRELKQLLEQWKAPGRAPDACEGRIFQNPWYRWLLTGSVRIPVPVLMLLLVLAGGGGLYAISKSQEKPPQKAISLADFQPVSEPKVRIIRRSHHENR
jgi:hypothetical protein